MLLLLLASLLHLSYTEAGHMAYNTSDVITTYTGHADAVRVPEFRKSGTEGKKVGVQERKGSRLKIEDEKREREEKGEGDVSDYLEQTTAATEASNDVVFIPSNNDAQSFSRRAGSAGRKDEYSVNDMMELVAVGDIINERYKTETEAPADGVVFKPGKNNEQTEEKIKHELDDEKVEQAVREYKEVYENPMDCENLDCENVLEPICGVKLENKRAKHRLFKNECFFRKVNCGLKYDYNRYRTVLIEECDGVGSHLPVPEQTGWVQYQPRALPRSNPQGPTSGRRSMSRRDYNEIKTRSPKNWYNQRKVERWPNGFKHDLIASQAKFKSKMAQYLARALGSRTG